jgi:outer membrane protein TolC
MNKTFKLLLFFILQISYARAQELLSLQQAVEIALKNNYSIVIAKNQAAISKNDFSAGNAGMLPSLTYVASGTEAGNNTKQNYSSGLEVDKKGVKSNNINTGLVLNWTIFDGFAMFASYDKLRELEAMGELNAKMQIENTVAKIIGAYFDVSRQKQLLNALNEAISIYQERLTIAETKSNIGSGTDADVLQAKLDLNEQKSALFRQKVSIANSKVALNLLLSRDIAADFDIKDSIVIVNQPKFDDLKTTVFKQNNGLLFAEKNQHVAHYLVKQASALQYPILGINANYNFSRAENAAGFILLNQNLGFNAGFTASWLLFNGLNTRRQIKDARINEQSAEIQYKEVHNEVETGLLTAFNTFVNAMELLKLEEDNIILARKNVSINLERFRLGYVTSLQLKDAQKSFLDAESRLVSARYDAKISETELNRLNGTLVK